MTSVQSKRSAYRQISEQLRAIARDLGIPASDYEIRPCYGGVAVPGEAIFHSENLYICCPLFIEDRNGTGLSSGGYFRSCRGRKDYTGGQNHWFRGSTPSVAHIRRALPAFRSVTTAA